MGDTQQKVRPAESVTGGAEANRLDAIARLERDVALLKDALLLLGINNCSQCGKYFRASDRGARFDGRELICMDCLSRWWSRRSEELSVKDREVVERKLLNWLVSYHGAKVIQHPASARENPAEAFHIVVNCPQCDGAGQAAGRRCGACEGRGSVWVVVPTQNGTGPPAPVARSK